MKVATSPDLVKLASVINKSEAHRRALLDVLQSMIVDKQAAYDRAKDALVMSEEPRTKALLLRGGLQALLDVKYIFEDYGK